VPDHMKSKKNCFGFFLYKESVADSNTIEFIKVCKTLKNGATVPQLYKYIHLAALTSDDRDKWVRAIRMNNSMSQFYAELSVKKMTKEQSSREAKRTRNRSQTMDSGLKKPAVRKSQIGVPCTSFVHYLDEDRSFNHTIFKDPNTFFQEKHVEPLAPEVGMYESLEDPQLQYIDDEDTNGIYSPIKETSEQGANNTSSRSTEYCSSRLSRIDEVSAPKVCHYPEEPKSSVTEIYSDCNAGQQENPTNCNNIQSLSTESKDSSLVKHSSRVYNLKIDTSELENDTESRETAMSSSGDSLDTTLDAQNSNVSTSDPRTNQIAGCVDNEQVQIRKKDDNDVAQAYKVHRVSVGNTKMLMKVDQRPNFRSTIHEDNTQISQYSNSNSSRIRIIYSPKRHNSAPEETIGPMLKHMESSFRFVPSRNTGSMEKMKKSIIVETSGHRCDFKKKGNRVCDEKSFVDEFGTPKTANKCDFGFYEGEKSSSESREKNVLAEAINVSTLLSLGRNHGVSEV